MTPLSLVPEQAKYRGISYEQLVQRLIDMALHDFGRGHGRDHGKGDQP